MGNSVFLKGLMLSYFNFPDSDDYVRIKKNALIYKPLGWTVVVAVEFKSHHGQRYYTLLKKDKDKDKITKSMCLLYKYLC